MGDICFLIVRYEKIRQINFNICYRGVNRHNIVILPKYHNGFSIISPRKLYGAVIKKIGHCLDD